MLYLLTLFLFFVFYVVIINLMKYMKNTAFWNVLFTISIYLTYISLAFKLYNDVGFYDWNFRNAWPVANVSQFMFFIVPLIHLLPLKVKRCFYGLITLLSVGMFISIAVNCIYNYSINYRFHPHFLLDYIAHFLLSLWGVYFVKSNQIKLNIKDSIKSGSIIVSVAFIMMILNVIFDTSFFGLSLNGKHNIYNNVLTDNSYVSALIYFMGLMFVLFSGHTFCKIIGNQKVLSNREKS